MNELDPEQRAVVTAVSGPVCVLAGAGTGKTRAITHRIAFAVENGHHDPARTLALTFTTRAAGEMRSRLRALGVKVQARTFHAAALRQLRYFWPSIVGGELPRLAPSKAEFISEALRRNGHGVDRSLVLDLATHIEWAKVGLVDATEFVESASDRLMPSSVSHHDVARIYRDYEAIKSENSAIDFEDVLLLLLGILNEHDEVSRQVRSQYRHFTVDEYQDVSLLQQRVLDAWLGDSQDLCVVGDPNQTIYSFAGASPAFLREFPKKYPNATVISLFRDYRSTPEIVELAKKIVATSDQTSRFDLAFSFDLKGMRPSGPTPRQREFSSDQDEAAWVASEVTLLLKKMHSHEIAVLFRTNGQSERYEAALADRGISYQVRGSERFFDRPEIKDAIRLLRGAAIAQSADVQSEVRAILTQLGWSSQPPAGPGAVRERWDSLNALVELSQPFTSLASLVEELEERAEHQHSPTLAGVTLASLHAAKGLEWDAVFLVGLRDGLMPISYATTEAAIEEERRLLYVGITRARQLLSLSWSGERSRFLAPGGSVGSPARVSLCHICGKGLTSGAERKVGRCSTCPSSASPELVTRLKEWRLAQASAASMPAFVIMTDATLVALAERAPKNLTELREIPGIGAAKVERYGEDLLALLKTPLRPA